MDLVKMIVLVFVGIITGVVIFGPLWYFISGKPLRDSGTEEVHKVPFKKLAARLWEDTVGAREKFMHIYLGGLSDAELNRLLTKLADLISKRLIRKQQTTPHDSTGRTGGEDNTPTTSDGHPAVRQSDWRKLFNDRL